MKNLDSFKTFNEIKSTIYYASAMPKGKLFVNRFDSNSILYKFISCISGFISIITSSIYTLVSNWNIDNTNELLKEFETSVKIPEQTPRLETDIKRRNAVKTLISKIPVVNTTDMVIYIKALTGIDVQISHEILSTNNFPLVFPIVFSYGYNLKQFIFVVKILNQSGQANNKFPMSFPVRFFDAKVDDTTTDKLNNVLKKIIPVYCDWYFTI